MDSESVWLPLTQKIPTHWIFLSLLFYSAMTFHFENFNLLWDCSGSSENSFWISFYIICITISFMGYWFTVSALPLSVFTHVSILVLLLFFTSKIMSHLWFTPALIPWCCSGLGYSSRDRWSPRSLLPPKNPFNTSSYIHSHCHGLKPCLHRLWLACSISFLVVSQHLGLTTSNPVVSTAATSHI